MDHFAYQDGVLHCESVPVDALADGVGTPLYVYSKATLLDHHARLRAAFAELDPIICYSIKSCGNLHICQLLAEAGAGMDVVSGGELFRAQRAGADMKKIVYAGVGKTDAEIRQAIEAGIGWFNIESEAEFENIAAIAKSLNLKAHGALRINPDVADPRTHAKTTTGSRETKFGVDIDRAERFFERYCREEHLMLDAVHLHIGSPIYSPEPYVKAITKTLDLIGRLRKRGLAIKTIDIGGGFAADYETGRSPDYADYAKAIVPLLKDRGLQVILEPGRTIAGNAGILVTEVLYLKENAGGDKNFVICDAGMNTLLRPAMYDAFHFIWPTQVEPAFVPDVRAETIDLPDLATVDIVGPICETGDRFAIDRAIPPVTRGDRLAIFTAGAYGMAMASHYNAMPLPAEVMVDGDQATVIRSRETYDDLVRAEQDPQPVDLPAASAASASHS